jgi:hypothetical protein
MARRKNSAALFEVIHADKRFKPSKTWSMPSIPSPLAWLRRRASEASVESTPAPAPAEPRSSQPSRLWSLLPSMPRVGMDLDPDRQVVSFRLTYTTALVGAFAIVAVVALAFVVGKQMHRRVGPALTDVTTDDLRGGPPQPDVLDVNNNDSAPMAMAATPVPAGAPTAAPSTPQTPRPTAPQHSGRTTFNEFKPPTTTSELNGKRTVNQQYVLIQTYPAAEKKLAEDACQMLCSRGILCTVEYNIDYAPNWYAVVGVTGFDRVRNVPQYDDYVARIQKVSDEFAGKSKFKRFRPTPIRWREPKPAGNG